MRQLLIVENNFKTNKRTKHLKRKASNNTINVRHAGGNTHLQNKRYFEPNPVNSDES
jgi:hypothetical protein